MILESYISSEIKGLSKVQLMDITKTILSIYDKVIIEEEDISPVLELLKHDKKNSHGNINFTLLVTVGESVINAKVSEDLLYRSIAYYNQA